MNVKVLIVDDSAFFRRKVADLLKGDPEIEVVGAASNGQEAVIMAKELRPHVITMDIDMPVMDGITAVRKIMAEVPTPILMLSYLTHAGAKSTLDSLEAGALDFLPKKFEEIASSKDEAVKILQQRVKSLSYRYIPKSRTIISVIPASKTPLLGAGSIAHCCCKESTLKKNISYKLVVMGTSTGGPMALQKILKQLPSNYPLPIILIQHMPSAFTSTFASRLNELCAISVKEGSDKEILKAGHAYLAPGGMQLLVEKGGVLRIVKGDPSISYKPSVDVTFASISKVYKDEALAIVLTGMGTDGKEGARLLHEAGSTVWCQDEASCVVYGMPSAVVKAGLATRSIALDEIGSAIISETMKK